MDKDDGILNYHKIFWLLGVIHLHGLPTGRNKMILIGLGHWLNTLLSKLKLVFTKQMVYFTLYYDLYSKIIYSNSFV